MKLEPRNVPLGAAGRVHRESSDEASDPPPTCPPKQRMPLRMGEAAKTGHNAPHQGA
jgi:hypothetical protein